MNYDEYEFGWLMENFDKMKRGELPISEPEPVELHRFLDPLSILNNMKNEN